MRTLPIALLFAASACSSTAAPAPVASDTGVDAPAGDGSTYPAGPYGLKEGDVLADAVLRGYLADPTHSDVTALPLVDTSLAKLRDAHPDCKCMLVAAAGRWCAPSINDQTNVLPTLLKPGRCIVSIVAEGPMPGQAANEDDLTVVGKKTKPQFPLVLAKELAPAIMKASASLPANFVVRTDTMEIVTEGSETTTTSVFDLCEAAK